MRRPLASLILGILFISALGCSRGANELSSSGSTLGDGSGSGGGGGGVTVPPPVVSTAAPLALSLYTVYDGEAKYNNELTFSETGTTTCQATDGTPSAICTVVVPEGRLYFSSIKFSYSWMTNKCKLLTFSPYFYLMSLSPVFVPPGATDPVDCSKLPTPADCYGGAARWLVPDFPKYIGLVHFPNEFIIPGPQSQELNLPSGYSNKWGSNRHSVNDITLGGGNVASSYTAADLGGVGDAYVANSYVNYDFSCRDDWYDPATYSIRLYIRDEDSAAGNPVINDFRTWKEL